MKYTVAEVTGFAKEAGMDLNTAIAALEGMGHTVSKNPLLGAKKAAKSEGTFGVNSVGKPDAGGYVKVNYWYDYGAGRITKTKSFRIALIKAIANFAA